MISSSFCTITKLMPTLISLGLALGLSGCASVTETIVERPKVGLDWVRVNNVRAEGATVVFGVKVDNPNSFPIKLDALRYDVEIGGRSMGSASLAHGVRIPASDSGMIEVPVPVKYKDLFSSVMEFMKSRTSTYRVKGEAMFGFFTVPFDSAGDFKLE
jgi:LEA14-like dessication related protein